MNVAPLHITARVRPFFGSKETEERDYLLSKAATGWVLEEQYPVRNVCQKFDKRNDFWGFFNRQSAKIIKMRDEQ